MSTESVEGKFTSCGYCKLIYACSIVASCLSHFFYVRLFMLQAANLLFLSYPMGDVAGVAFVCLGKQCGLFWPNAGGLSQ